MSLVKTVLITGANRGIGFNLVKEITTVLKPEFLFATFRNVAQAKELESFANANTTVHPIQFDVRDFNKYDELANEVEAKTKEAGLNLLINNAGISSKYARLSGVRKEDLVASFETNTIAPILLTKAFLNQLQKAAESVPDKDAPWGIKRAAVVNISSILGSIASNDNGGLFPYRCSKAALNAATKSMSIDFQKTKILAVVIHPGWVQTDMGGPKAPITPAESVKGIVQVIKDLNETHNGEFIQYDGEKLPW
jgi:NAD(P)-dependent dehydrogenase (short-subunit alcohol dehydrogenase family)